VRPQQGTENPISDFRFVASAFQYGIPDGIGRRWFIAAALFQPSQCRGLFSYIFGLAIFFGQINLRITRLLAPLAAMVDYRIYTVGEDGHFTGPPIEVECADDREVVALAMQMKNGLDMETLTVNRMTKRLWSQITPSATARSRV
jgi:hypothetical protein